MIDDRIRRSRAIISKLETLIAKNRKNVDSIEIAECEYEFSEKMDLSNYSFSTFSRDFTWGGEDQHFIFKADLSSLNLEEGKEYHIELKTGASNIWNTNNPQIIAFVNGKAKYTFDMNHHTWPITYPLESLFFYAYSNVKEKTNFFHLDIYEKEKEVEALYFDFKVIYDAINLLSDLDARKEDAISALDSAINLIDFRSPYSQRFEESVKDARKYIRKNYYELLPMSPVTIHAVGHTHIDIAWKWPLRQTWEKAVRSILTVSNLMDEYPEYKFMLSQPVLYNAVKELYPSLYNKVLSLIKEGRWEAEGAMYLESETNLSSLSALMHQFEYGLDFFEKELKAKRPEILWLPDCFGFSSVIPSLMNLYGIKYFATTKIGWNDTNLFPYDTFIWRSDDGKSVLAHFITTTNYKENGSPSANTTYNALNTAEQNLGTWQRYQQKDKSRSLITAYGYGDGGGGPTREMIERAKRMQKSVAGLCNMKFSHALPFFKSLEKEIEGKEIDTWTGELYLEYHRGTYTSQCETKKLNRIVEASTEDAEFFSVLSNIDNSKELKKSWMCLIMNDFHDVLPGSSIAEVYREAEREYKKAIGRNDEIINSSLSSLVEDKEAITIFNTAPLKRRDIIELDEKPQYLQSEKSYDGKYIAITPAIPSYGYLTLKDKEDKKENGKVLKATGDLSYESKFYSFKLNGKGEISSLVDKEFSREAVKCGKVINKILFYEDIPTDYDAWNTENYYRKKSYKADSVKIELIENNSLRAIIKVERKFNNSSVSSDVIFYSHTKRIDFKTTIDYQEHQSLIKAEFDLDIETSDVYADMQAGETRRSTLNNTFWEKAQFEIPAHKYIRLDENGYGFALLSDSRYGYSAKYGKISISLLKGGIYPDPDQDVGLHETTYSLLPYSDKNEVIEEAYNINRKFYIKKGSYKSGSFVSVDDGIIIDSIRMADDNSILITCYEKDGKRENARFIAENAYDIYEAKLDGSDDVLLEKGKNEFNLFFKPREIKVIKLRNI